MKMVPVGESFLYVGVYIGELISSNLSVAFPGNWRATLKGVGIAGFVVFLALVLLVREPARRREYLNPHIAASSGVDLRNSFDNDELNSKSLTPSSVVADTPRRFAHLRGRKGEFMASLVHIVRMASRNRNKTIVMTNLFEDLSALFLVNHCLGCLSTTEWQCIRVLHAKLPWGIFSRLS